MNNGGGQEGDRNAVEVARQMAYQGKNAEFFSRLGCFRSSSSAESSFSTLVDAVMPYIPIRFRDEESISVEKILSLESIQQALSDSISTDLRFHGSDATASL